MTNRDFQDKLPNLGFSDCKVLTLFEGSAEGLMES